MPRRKTSLQNFLKSYDGYAKPVSLMYKRQGQFTTSIGGVCSIFKFIALSYWLTLNFIEVLVPPSVFAISAERKLTELENKADYKPLQIPQDKLFSAYNIVASDDANIPNHEIQNYVIGLWF